MFGLRGHGPFEAFPMTSCETSLNLSASKSGDFPGADTAPAGASYSYLHVLAKSGRLIAEADLESAQARNDTQAVHAAHEAIKAATHTMMRLESAIRRAQWRSPKPIPAPSVASQTLATATASAAFGLSRPRRATCGLAKRVAPRPKNGRAKNDQTR